MKNITVIPLLYLLIKVNAKCWSEPDFPCCKDTTEIVYEDEEGTWGMENGDWCGIVNEDDFCWSEVMGIPCCASNNTEIVSVNMYGSWGLDEQGYTCGIKKYIPGYNDREVFDETREEWNQFKTKWDEELKYEFERLSVFVGDNESKLNFGWVCAEKTMPYIRYGLAEDDIRTYKTFNGTVEFYRELNGTLYYSKKVEITGLKPNTKYKYQRRIYDEWEEPVEFTTKDPNKFNFIFVGDPQIGGSIGSMSALHFEKRLNYEESIRNDAFNWNMTITSAFEQAGQPSLLISAGDQIDTQAYDHYGPDFVLQEYEYSAFLYPKLLGTIPTTACVGNHEMYTTSFRNHFNVPNPFYESEAYVSWEGQYDEYIPGYSYFFKYNNVLVVVLETNFGTCYDFARVIYGAFYNYSDTDWRIAVFHHDIYGNGEYHSQEESILLLRPCLTQLFSEYKFDVVINGHDHAYTATKFISYGSIGKIYNISELQKDVVNSSPKGTLYITANCATASKLYGFIERVPDYVNNFNQTYTSTFGILDFEKTNDKVRLTINSYEVEGKKVIDGPYIIEKPIRCWAEKLGYNCCRRYDTQAVRVDRNGQWGTQFDYEGNKEECGIIDPNIDYSVGNDSTTTKTTKTIPTSSTTINPTTVSITAEITTTAAITTTIATSTATTSTATTTTDTEPTPSCWAKKLGFRCCSNPNAVVYETTEDGQWSIENVEDSEYYGIEWCGIVRSSEIEVPEECWAKELGYNCCVDPNTIVEYSYGGRNWGTEMNEYGYMDWCGIVGK